MWGKSINQIFRNHVNALAHSLGELNENSVKWKMKEKEKKNDKKKSTPCVCAMCATERICMLWG